MKSLFFFLSIFFAFLTTAFAQKTGVQGKVVDENREPLPFLTIYLEDGTQSTTTNANGDYFLALPKGEYQIIFRFVGYETVSKTVEINQEVVTLDLEMKPVSFLLKEVEITPDKENPAYAIIRQAQRKRTFYRDELKAYSFKSYIKCIQKLDEFDVPRLFIGKKEQDEIKRQMKENKGIVYLSESISRCYFKAPNSKKEVMIASKVSGNSNGFSWNSTTDMLLNLYENQQNIQVAPRPFVSPIAQNAFSHYEYRYLGETNDRGRLVHKIEVLPKNKYGALYSGEIFIQDSTWRIHSVNLLVKKEAGLEYLEYVKIKQVFVPLAGDIWQLGTQVFDFRLDVGMMGVKVKGNGSYAGSFSEYNLEPRFTQNSLKKDLGNKYIPTKSAKAKTKKVASRQQTQKQSNKDLKTNQKEIVKKEDEIDKKEAKAFFKGETMLIPDSVNKKTEAFWLEQRPVPLTAEEKEDYVRKDSIELVVNSKAYLDSTDKVNNRFKFNSLLFGYTYQNRHKKYRLSTSSLINGLSFNTVEGWVVNPSINLVKYDNEKYRYHSNLFSVRYGFSSKKWYYTFNHFTTFDLVKRRQFRFIAQRDINQFHVGAIQPFINTLYTIFAEENYIKLYERDLIHFAYNQELFNGVSIYLAGQWENRRTLQNATNLPKTYIDYEHKIFDTNNPIPIEDPNVLPTQSKAVLLSANLRVRLKQTYLMRPYQKVVLETPYPTLYLRYQMGVPILGASSNFHRITLEINDQTKVGRIGNLQYLFKAGTFLQAQNLTFFDYQHFDTSPILLARSENLLFLNLPYYAHSTNGNFVEGHLEHDFGGFLMKKLPLFRKTTATFVIKGSYLYTSQNTQVSKPVHYAEISFGVTKILKTLRLDLVHSWKSNWATQEGIYYQNPWGLRLRFNN
ncbi:DUF5686 and carboxypeptidase regulatory-like domain-containing protein [Hugenholtzia roseola]|uniref:DUF5686 and carboxypeptidase regulatory-like domain-containing protein n=1 Tax=Hugenholtzia roseola TaxID=1002 RepID=UPI00137810C5|nr:DUF5686 and carboxypeptidase regulatory-like domain-containing protein [Hugenholtzia roseola]